MRTFLVTALLCGFVICYVGFIPACQNRAKQGSGQLVADSNFQKGKILAGRFCGSCHLLPDPLLLDKRSWEKGVLPNMGPRLGVFSFLGKTYPSSRYDPGVDRSYYPSAPLVSADQWQNIIDYYLAASPDSLPGQDRKEPIRMGLDLFSVETPGGSHKNPVSAFVRIDTNLPGRRVWVGSMLPGALLQFNGNLQMTDSTPVKGAVVDMNIRQGARIACNIGIINPNNGKFGSVSGMRTDRFGKSKLDAQPQFSGLARPVQVIAADLNQDKRVDYLICEFGNLSGALSWMENAGDGKFVRHVLRNAPGAIKAYVQDYNHDGLPDIWVLFAQGDEGIFLFTNKGHGQFDEEEVLRFPPVYGSSYFELDDFNKDGFPDILYTCGDNADYSQVLKPYHGVYIFTNDGHNHFRQSWFFPINGCYRAMARDFDGDGDLDIASIAFFADYARQPEEGFVYLENRGNWQFRPYSLPAGKSGRWISMDVGDLDGDGKEDIILGNFSVGPTLWKSAVNWKEGPLFLILKNKSPRH